MGGRPPTHGGASVRSVPRFKRALGKHVVHRHGAGDTRRRDASETPGRKRSLSPADMCKLDRARRRMIQKADNQKRISYEDVVEEAGFEGKVSERV
jgi:hypothetical protein